MKTINQPKGKAGEYAKYAVNFYNGCSNGCEYCYLKRGVLKKTLGGNTPMLKKIFKDEAWALHDFKHDLICSKFRDDIRKHGLFFTFTSDPFLEETWKLNWLAACYAVDEGIPVTMLTKRADFIDKISYTFGSFPHDRIAVGFTLTGHDELEPGASSNEERIKAMKQLHDAGFRTWASIEPVVDVEASLEMMKDCEGFCDHYKVGLEETKAIVISRRKWVKELLKSLER